MITINTPLTVFKDNSRDFIDRRTINALSGVNIFTIKELMDYCVDENFEWKLSLVKGLWKSWVSKLKKLIKFLKEDWVFEENGVGSEYKNSPRIDQKIYQTSLWLYWKHISLRTLNALNNIWIFSIQDLFDNRSKYLYWVKWLGKTWLKEIEKFTFYVNKNFAINEEKAENNSIKDILSDNRLLNILNFHSIYELDQLKPYIEGTSKFDTLRYFNNKDFEILKTLYFENIKSIKNEEQTFSETFLNLLNNFSEVDKVILENRILWNNTLSEIWEKLWITRERVRQKQKSIEIIIMDHWNLFMKQNPEILNKLLNLVNLYKFIFLPQDIKIFDFLWFNESDLALLYLSLKWLDGLTLEIIDNKIYCIFWEDIDLTAMELRNLYDYVNEKIRKNNDDIDIEDLFYECKLDNIFDKKFNKTLTIKETESNIGWCNGEIEEEEYFYVKKEDLYNRTNKTSSIYELIL